MQLETIEVSYKVEELGVCRYGPVLRDARAGKAKRSDPSIQVLR
jgi:hypothetical protein